MTWTKRFSFSTTEYTTIGNKRYSVEQDLSSKKWVAKELTPNPTFDYYHTDRFIGSANTIEEAKAIIENLN